MISIRRFRTDDGPALLALFRDTIRRVNSKDYTPEQIEAWASDEIDEAAWVLRLSLRFVVVAELDGAIAGFAELDDGGLIDRFFVAADHQRCGVGAKMFEAILAEARSRGLNWLRADVSITARPFFERCGLEVIDPQDVEVRGVTLRNLRMERMLYEVSEPIRAAITKLHPTDAAARIERMEVATRSERVQGNILALSFGDAERFEQLCDLAILDPRDVMIIEYFPEDFVEGDRQQAAAELERRFRSLGLHVPESIADFARER